MEARECSTSPGTSLRLSQWLTLCLNKKNWDAPYFKGLGAGLNLFYTVLYTFSPGFCRGGFDEIICLLTDMSDKPAL